MHFLIDNVLYLEVTGSTEYLLRAQIEMSSVRLSVLKAEYTISDMFWTLTNHWFGLCPCVPQIWAQVCCTNISLIWSRSYLFIGHVLAQRWVVVCCYKRPLFNLTVLFKPVCVNWPKKHFTLTCCVSLSLLKALLLENRTSLS